MKDKAEKKTSASGGGKNAKSRRAYRRKKGAIVAAITLIYLVIVAAAAVIIDDRHVEITLLGDADQLAEVGATYPDPGAEAYLTGNLFGTMTQPVELRVDSGVDTSRIGDYTVKYSAEAFGKSAESYRVVHVRDTTPPVITLEHEEGYQASWLVGYKEEGFSAYDNYDGDLTDKVVRTETDGAVYYSVVDSSGNESAAERVIEYGISEPMIRLTGGDEIEVGAAFSFTDPGYEATDESGNDLTSYVQVTGEVIPYQVGTYTLNYHIMNERGETATAQRTVRVVPQSPVETVIPQEKTIYLTFDDGPSQYTSKLLDVLARYGVKATFFVTNLDPDYQDMIGRAFREGHSIGVHSVSHNYALIYQSRDAFFRDFQGMQDIIYEQTGSYTKLFRFPGGSSNTVSSFNPGIMSRLTRAMNDLGYQYFDWNVVSGDAGETNKTNKIVEKIEEGCRENRISIILQHDIKDYSVAAVEDVIIWGLQNGYSFRALELDSPAMHHGVNN